jgi:hypothetical protein
LRKVESSTLKECEKEKAREVLHPKCKNERRKIHSLLFMHFFSYDLIFFLLLEKKKMLRRKHLKRKGRNTKIEVGAKSERAK